MLTTINSNRWFSLFTALLLLAYTAPAFGQNQESIDKMETEAKGQEPDRSQVLPPETQIALAIQVNDTDFSKGSLGNLQSIELSDLGRFHGHLCDGLVEGFLALQLGLKNLYPNEPIDRTNLRIVSKSSPCLADAAIYLTGARWQYGTFYIDNTIEGLYVLQQIDSGQAIAISRNEGVKPAIIDEMGQQAIKQQLSSCQLRELKTLEDAYAALLLRQTPEALFQTRRLENFHWNPVLKNDYLKTDILNKNQPKCSQEEGYK